MHNPIDLEVVSSEALRKLGRNVLNFSKIEAGFKLFLSVNHVEGTTTNISNNIKAKQRKLHKKSLGTLVREFNKSVFRETQESNPPEHLTKPWVSLAVTVSPEHSRKWKQKLRTLVEERNKLIHHDLASIDVNSVEDYQGLITILDEQNPRLLAHLDDLRWMLSSLSETVQGLRQSPDFIQLATLSKKQSSGR